MQHLLSVFVQGGANGIVVNFTGTGTTSGYVQRVDTTNTMINVEQIDDLINRQIDEMPSLLGDGLIVPKGRLVIYGAPGSFKSFAVMQLCYSLALGNDWLGYDVHGKIKVLYMQAEIVERRLQDRAAKMFEFYGEAENFSTSYTRDFSLRGEQSWQELADAVERSEADFIFLDPLSQLLPGSEVDDKAMRNFLQGLDLLSTHADCGIGLVHHARKGVYSGDGVLYKGAENLRGWSGLNGWTDTVIRLNNPRGIEKNTIEISWEKVRHGPEPLEKWLRFDADSGILVESDSDPKKLVYKALRDGPQTIDEVDRVLIKQGGKSGRTAGRFRKELEKKNVVIQYERPGDKRFKMIEWVDRPIT